MIHMAAQRGSITEAFETLVDLQHAGLIRHLGVFGAVLLRYVRQPELAPPQAPTWLSCWADPLAWVRS
ncbi:hypothetical protein [Streptomyces sp. NTK 937]|uniref:hypothetical protein n=1 Tax=Streptomyces sp. NTK 937 TaxID=1487711 RepID=UPI0004A93060|nr:hypothetical protein [Streptomyces sp. NTK 937]KDQ71192.1 hypothetical protein DT87_29535 [Streptomyces sp. NTK 937]